MDDLTLAEKAVGAGLRLYDKFADRKTMPTNRRIFLESVLDKSKEPITETAFTPAELNTLGQIIFNKYKSIDEPLSAYEKVLTEKMAKHKAAVAAKNKDQIMFPEFVKRYEQDLDAIRAYRQGKLTPEFISLAAGKGDYPRQTTLSKLNLMDRFNIQPIVTYTDYGKDLTQARTATAGANPADALHTTLGQFKYQIDPDTGALVVVDKYDFNPMRATATTPFGLAETVATMPETGGTAIYRLLREYAGRVLPEGSGRDVRVQLNNLAPQPLNALTQR